MTSVSTIHEQNNLYWTIFFQLFVFLTCLGSCAGVISKMVMARVGGASFGYFIIFDFIFPFLLEASPENVKATISIDDALGTTTKLLLGFGVSFQLPVVAFFCGRAGIIDHKDLMKFFRYAIVAIFVVSALLTPPDPISQCMMAVPLTTLYGISIVLVWLTHKKVDPDAPLVIE